MQTVLVNEPCWLANISVDEIQYSPNGEIVKCTPTSISIWASDIDKIVGSRPTQTQGANGEGQNKESSRLIRAIDAFVNVVSAIDKVLSAVNKALSKISGCQHVEHFEVQARLILKNGQEYGINDPIVYDKLQKALLSSNGYVAK